MSIPTAEDGVTLINATLLNAYKAGIEACEPSLGIPNESGYVLTSTAEGGRAWAPPPSASPTTTAGDLVVRGAQADERLPVGSEGQALLVSGGAPAWRDVSSIVLPSVCDGRLTLTQGLPVTVADVTGASHIYFSRYQGAHVALWDGTAWRYHEIPSGDVVLTLTGLTTGAVYDVFLGDDDGTLTLSMSSAWTDDTTRANPLAQRDGVRVLAGNHTKRLVGTICATGEAATADGGNVRYVRNEAHPVRRLAYAVTNAATWTYGTAVFRPLNNDSGCSVRYLSDGSTAMDLTAKVAYRPGPTEADRQIGFALDVIVADSCYQLPSSNYWDERAMNVRGDYQSVRVPIMAAEGRHTVWPVEKIGGQETVVEWPGCHGEVWS